MRGAAGVLLGAAMKQRRVGEARAANRRAAPIEKQCGAALHFTIQRQRRGARDRCIWRRMSVYGHAEGVVETNAGLLHDLWRQVFSSQPYEKIGKIG